MTREPKKGGPQIPTNRRVCTARKANTHLCARTPDWWMRISVAGFEAILFACTPCKDTAPASLGYWTEI